MRGFCIRKRQCCPLINVQYRYFLIVISFISGALLERVDIPVNKVTSCCFGGPDLNELYVTTANKFSSEDLSPDNPLDGSLFRVRGLSTRGAPVSMFNG